MLAEIIFIVWLAGFIIAFLIQCRIERFKLLDQREGAGSIIFFSIIWPLMVMLVVAMSPFMFLVWVYEKLTRLQ